MAMGIDVTELVGKRALMKIRTGRYGDGAITEYRIMEVSPSGNWVRVMKEGHAFWAAVVECSLVEELLPLRPARDVA
jgi:hypothetical protein